jgi:hypothetical protein
MNHQPRITKRIQRLRAMATGIEENGRLYLVLEQSPRTGQTSPCAFCGKRHWHGVGAGHRCTHCSLDVSFTNDLGQEFRSDDGYILKLKERKR